MYRFLALLHRACDRYQWQCHAYCLMSNHYHLLIEIQTPTLSKVMNRIGLWAILVAKGKSPKKNTKRLYKLEIVNRAPGKP